MFNLQQAPAAKDAAGDDQSRLRQMLAMGLMNAAAQQNPTTSKKGANANILAQGLAGALGGYMAGKGMQGGQQPNIWAPGFDGAPGGWTGQR